MTDPHDATQPTEEQQVSSPDEQSGIDELDVRPEDADRVKGGRAEDPCMGGQVKKR